MTVRYVGTKGTKLYAGIPQNYTKFSSNGLLEAFNVARAGGNAPLFDQMLRGLVFNAGQGAVNGSTVTGFLERHHLRLEPRAGRLRHGLRQGLPRP